MIHAIIGLIVGIIMGLTGAGGALVAIPLFIALLDTSIKEATVLSLIAVSLGAAINLFAGKNEFDKKIILFFFVFGSIANYLTLSIKKDIPDLMIGVLLLAIGLYSIRNVWRKDPSSRVGGHPSLLKMAFTGIFIGVITTLTGLGGGVLLVPLLIGLFGKSYEEALPNSLLTILLISLLSFFLQYKTAVNLLQLKDFSALAGGVLVSFFILKMIIKKLSQTKLDYLRKVVFTIVTIYSVTTVLLKAL